MLSDLYRNPQGTVLIDAVAPILDPKGQPIAVGLFRSNAESLLYPLIQSWPTSSRTAETLLIRKDGDGVLFLNDLRHRPNTALSLREPLSLTDLPAVQAVLGKQGMFHGRDYRGVDVLADLRPVPDSPWFMVAKVDAFEILAEARYRGGVTALFAGLFILLAAGVTAYGYRYRQARLYQDLYRSEREQREAQEEFRTTLYSIGDAVITTDTGGLVKQMNPVAELLTGWLEAEAKGKPLDEVFHIVNEDSREEVENPVQRVLREGQVVGLANHTLLISKEGTERPIADSGSPICDESGAITGVVLVFRDQMEERAAQKALQEQYEELEKSQRHEAFLADLIERSSQPLGVGYPDGRLGTVNEAFCRLTGYSRDELATIEWAKVLTPPEWLEIELSKLEELHRTDQAVRYEKEYVRKDGNRVPIELLVHLVRDESGAPQYYYAFINDITERKRSEESLQHTASMLRGVLAASPIGIVLTQDRKIHWANDAWEKMFGFDNECEYMDQPTSIMHPSQENYEQVRRILYDNVNPGEVSETEATLARKNGTLFDAQISVNLLDHSDPSKGAISTISDISQRKRTEEALRESEERFRKIFDFAPDPYFLIDVQGRFLDGNIAAEEMIGYEKAELIGKTFLEVAILLPEQIPLAFELLKASARGKPTGPNELGLVRKDGQPVDVEIRTFPIQMEEKTVVLGIARDISERKRSEEALRESEKRYRSLFEHMPEGLAYCQMFFEDGKPQDFVYLDVNDSFERLTGLKEVVGKKVTEVIPGIRESNPELFEVYGRAALTGNPERLETYVEPLGIWFSISVYSTEREHFIAVFDNVTERKHAEELLRQAERGYRLLFEEAPLMYVITRNERGVPLVSDCNELFLGSVGYSREETVGKPLAHFYSPESRSELLERGGYARALAGEFFIGERQLLTRDGRLIPTLLHTATEVDASGEVIGTRAMFVDITERKRAEEALSKQAEFMAHLMEAIPLPVFFKDVNHMYVGCNNAFAQFVGLPKERIVGKPVFDVVSQETAELFKQHDETLFRNPGTQVYATSVKLSDGSTREVIFNKATYGDPDGPASGLIGVILDITDRKILERQLLQAQKMEAIGTLAGGIAHDFNNLLQVVLGYSELLLAEKREDDPEYADLSKILQSARSGAELVQRLLTFSRKVEPKPIPLNLNRRILQVEKLLRRTIPKMIDIQMDLSDDLAEINADPTQMEQVLMNLAVNARDAMPDRGKLTVGTKNVTLDEEYSRIHGEAKPGKYVLLTVSDTGHGMDKGTIDHIFEPFYTTKELGRGTGLGLAMVYGIVKQHGGYINCYSEVEHGTTFNVYLPAIEGQVEPELDKTQVMPAFGTETILLVDDEEFVRDLGARILSKAGYNVLTATNGREALDLFEKERAQISLMILDLIMPEMGGNECLRELRKIDPQLKVLIASGLSTDPSTKESVEMGTRGFVSKPFRMKEFLRQVRQVLDEG